MLRVIYGTKAVEYTPYMITAVIQRRSAKFILTEIISCS